MKASEAKSLVEQYNLTKQKDNEQKTLESLKDVFKLVKEASSRGENQLILSELNESEFNKLKEFGYKIEVPGYRNNSSYLLLNFLYPRSYILKW